MTNSVADRCLAIATYRHVSVSLMETLARWTPTTPEMEAKVMFGRHVWDFAQTADALGHRTYELRQPKHHSLPPVDQYAALLRDVASARSTHDRIAMFYGGFLPGLGRRLRHYNATTDPILDEPSVVILERMLGDLERHGQEAQALQRELGLDSSVPAELAARDKSIDSIVRERVAS